MTDPHWLEVNVAQPISYPLGVSTGERIAGLAEARENGVWRTTDQAIWAHIDALMAFSTEAVNTIRALEIEVQRLRS